MKNSPSILSQREFGGMPASDMLARGRHHFLEQVFVFLWFLALTFSLAWLREYPYIYDDEYGVLGAAAVLAGYAWTTPANMPFYGFGLSILIAPLFKLGLDPITLYRSVLSVNGLLLAGSAVLAVRTLSLFSLPISRLTRVSVVLAAFNYPAVLFYSGLAMGETVLLFCFMLIAYSLVTSIGHREPKYAMPMLLGLGLAMAPYAHARGLVFWLAILPVFWLAVQAKWLAPKAVAIALSSAFLGTAALAAVKAWLVTNFYSVVRSGTASATDFMAERLDLLQPDQFVVIAQVAFGQFSYLMTSSFGLVFGGLIAILVATRSLVSSFGNQGRIVDMGDQRIVIAAALVGLSFVLMFAISVLQMGTPVRADHFFYGRYNEVMLPPVLIAALLFFTTFERWQRGARLMWLAAGLILAALLMLFVSRFPTEIFEHPMIWNSISGWFVHIQGPWKIEPMTVAIGTLIGGFTLATALVVSRRVFVLTIVAMFTAAALHNYDIQHRGGDRAWAWFAELGEVYGASFAGKEVAIAGDPIMGRISGEALQFSMPRARVTFDPQKTGEADAILDLTGDSCSTGNTVERVGNVSLCVHNAALRAEIQQSTTRIDMPSLARSKVPARIRFGSAEIVTGGIVTRGCASAAQFFYSSWSRHCLPGAIIYIERQGLSGDERQELGLFITDTAGRWRGEMRAKMDTHLLARNEAFTAKIPVQFDWKLPSGTYTLHAAILDADGWDWRSVASMKLKLK